MSNGVQERQPTGWTVFAGMVLVIVGFLDALWGLAGILNDQVVVVGGHGADRRRRDDLGMGPPDSRIDHRPHGNGAVHGKLDGARGWRFSS